MMADDDKRVIELGKKIGDIRTEKAMESISILFHLRGEEASTLLLTKCSNAIRTITPAPFLDGSQYPRKPQ
jgi:hypothetical protein